MVADLLADYAADALHEVLTTGGRLPNLRFTHTGAAQSPRILGRLPRPDTDAGFAGD